MSKRLGNAGTAEKRVAGMDTDPNRVRGDIPGTVKGNPVFARRHAFDCDQAEVQAPKARCRAGRSPSPLSCA